MTQIFDQRRGRMLPLLCIVLSALACSFAGAQTTFEKVYNRQIQLIVNKQEDEIARLKHNIEEVTGIQRGVTPLMLSMIEILDQFVRLDLPFFLEARVTRVDKLRSLMDDPNVAVSEKFRQVLLAFQIESEYGRTIEATTTEIVIDGQERNVQVLRIGRISLAFQTDDGKETGWYNPATRQWESLGDSYTIPIRNGLKIANKQMTQGLIHVPIYVPQPSAAEGE